MNIDSNISVPAIYRENSNIIWCVSRRDSYLYRINLGKGIQEEVMPLLDKVNARWPFSDILEYKDFFIFVPRYSDSVVMLNRHSWTRERIPIPQAGWRIGSDEAKFSTGIIYNDCLYMLGLSYPGIVKLNLLSKEITVMDTWLRDANLMFTNEVEGCFPKNYCMNDNVLYLPFKNANAIMIFNLSNEEMAVYRVGDSYQRYVSIEWDGSSFWLMPRDWSVGKIVKWNPMSNDVEYYGEYPEGFNYHPLAFHKTVNIGDEIFLFAQRANMNIRLDISTGKMRVLSDIYDASNVKGAKHSIVQLDHEKIFFFCEEQCIWWDYVSGKKEYLPYSVDKKIFERYENEHIREYFNKINDGRIIREKEEVNIISLIKYLKMLEE